jgi:hypothetical protein
MIPTTLYRLSVVLAGIRDEDTTISQRPTE